MSVCFHSHFKTPFTSIYALKILLQKHNKKYLIKIGKLFVKPSHFHYLSTASSIIFVSLSKDLLILSSLSPILTKRYRLTATGNPTLFISPIICSYNSHHLPSILLTTIYAPLKVFSVFLLFYPSHIESYCSYYCNQVLFV